MTRFAAAMLCLAVGLSIWAPAATAANDRAATAFISEIGQRTLLAMNYQGLSDAEREERLGEMMREGLDIEGLGRYTLGHFLRQSNPEKVAEFQVWFERYIVMFYPRVMLQFPFVEFSVDGAKSVGDRDLMVSTQLKFGDGGGVAADWQVRDFDGKLRIVDVKVEGNSLRRYTRAKFARVLRKQWIDGLIATLKDWVTSGRETPVF
jgi:phospholipid transport system substrate-binding protein